MVRLNAAAAALLLSAVTLSYGQSDLDFAAVLTRLTQAQQRIRQGRHLPVVDGDAPAASPGTSAARRAYAFNGNGSVLGSIDMRPGVRRSKIVDYIAGFPLALPVTGSDLIVYGAVTSARAELSIDRTNVFSVFEVDVRRVLMQREAPHISAAAVVAVVREGGIVRFPGGDITFERHDWSMPRPGRDHVLFLKKHFHSAEALEILTGYSVEGGRVAALDANLQSVVWDDRPAAELLEEIARLVQQDAR